MRFILVDKKIRLFQTNRFCYHGSIDDWIEIGSPGKISDLAKQYVKCIGTDAYYELV